MRMRLAAALSAAIVLVGMVGAPVMPVMIGTALTYGWLAWRARREEARHPVTVPRNR